MVLPSLEPEIRPKINSGALNGNFRIYRFYGRQWGGGAQRVSTALFLSCPLRVGVTREISAKRNYMLQIKR
jgi:hypothetical protein